MESTTNPLLWFSVIDLSQSTDCVPSSRRKTTITISVVEKQSSERTKPFSILILSPWETDFNSWVTSIVYIHSQLSGFGRLSLSDCSSSALLPTECLTSNYFGCRPVSSLCSSSRTQDSLADCVCYDSRVLIIPTRNAQ